ncbi:hypothetical protein D9619_007242 [Psilocybe cf. subviscida]|uniref:Uncharacterized protein n=1 Tax=Psilocybe cf. subviscida TaxID=2480587 RepID=A0A8H5B1I4_9AGAR|nr:hypothetical protein D9619_007242 [Psilocybe cf. subviscida]
MATKTATSEQEYYVDVITRPVGPQRRRTLSLLSISSRSSAGSGFTLDFPKSPSTSGLSQQPDAHFAHGSFIPVRPAMTTLENFARCATPPIAKVPLKKKRKVTFSDKCTYSPSWSEDEAEDSGYTIHSSSTSSPSKTIPRITHTTTPSSSVIDPPSPSSSPGSKDSLAFALSSASAQRAPKRGTIFRDVPSAMICGARVHVAW